MFLLARLVRAVILSLLLLLLVFAAAVFALRYQVLPNIQDYREQVADALSEAAGQPIRFDTIDANWDGPRPRLVLGGVRVHDSTGSPVLEIGHMASTLSWQSLVRFEPLLHLLVIDGLQLTVRRDPRGIVHVAGLAIDPSRKEPGFADWLLDQKEVSVRGARVTWADQLRGSPPLELTGLDLRLHEHMLHHESTLRGMLPPGLGGPFEAEVRMAGVRRAADLLRGKGRIALQVGDVDVQTLRRWVDLPAQLERGRGTLDLALEIVDGAPVALNAAVKLSQLRLATVPELAPLELARFSGRLAWQRVDGADLYSGDGLQLEERSAGPLGPLDLKLRLPVAGAGVEGRGELEVNAVDVAVAGRLAQQLPIPQPLRMRLAALSPRGRLSGVSAQWRGDWSAPASYEARLAFAELSVNAAEGWPGVSGLSGSVDATGKGGTLRLESRGLVLDLPGTLREPLAFASFTAQAAWQRGAGRTELKVSNAAFSSDHLAGTAFATYRTAEQGPGFLDLTGTLSRADVRHVPRYIPFQVNPDVRAWLDRAVIAGAAENVQVRIRGDLGRFPFRKDSDGLFEVGARISNGVLDYAEGWPRIENLATDLLFRGVRMEVNARGGSILGAQLGRVKAVIPDLDATDQQRLTVDGEARGPTSEFLRFVAESPVMVTIDRFTEGIGASGQGRLRLRLDLPLHDIDATRVSGQYQFVDNRVTLGDGLWPVDQVNGVVSFTENTVEAPGIRGVALGGPLVVQFGSRPGGKVSVTAQGQATAVGLQRSVAGEWGRHLRGATEWNGRFDFDHGRLDYQIESELAGLEVDMPAPLGKLPGESRRLRFRLEGAQGQRRQIAASYGSLVSAKLVMADRSGAAVIERGTIGLGEPAPAPEREGIWISGTLKELNYDRWRSFLDGSGPAIDLPLAGMDLRLGRLDLFGRSLHELKLKATRQANSWRARVDSREAVGDLTWSGAGRGALTARLDTLILAAADERPEAGIKTEVRAEDWELPAVDIRVENFQSSDVALGRLELLASQAGADWRIERAAITNPDATLTASGAWRGWLARPETALDLKLEIADSGRLLARFGHPEAMSGGAGSIEGRLAWAGAPAALDFASLGGNLKLQVGKGQFRQAKPGIGKLLGILSLQSLVRRFALDFRDVFSEGFAFDSIAASVSIHQGVMHTDNFRMAGPSARVEMKGDVDIMKQTQSLSMRVQPTLAEGVSVAGAVLGGPAVGIGALVLQKLLKDPIEQLISFEYLVEGTWSEPKVSKKSAARGSTP